MMASLIASPIGLGVPQLVPCAGAASGAALYSSVSSQSAFTSKALQYHTASLAHPRRQRHGTLHTRVVASRKSGEEPSEGAPEEQARGQVARSGVALLAAGLLLLAPGGDALAAKSGGRVGGSAFRSSGPSAPHVNPAPRVAPRINNSRTYIFGGPTFAPPPVYAPPVYGGGFVTPYYAPSVSFVSTGGGVLSALVFLIVVSVVVGFFL